MSKNYLLMKFEGSEYQRLTILAQKTGKSRAQVAKDAIRYYEHWMNNCEWVEEQLAQKSEKVQESSTYIRK